jgi:hypothetical protein
MHQKTLYFHNLGNYEGIGAGNKDGIAGGKSNRGEKDKGFVLSESMALVHAREILALSNR